MSRETGKSEVPKRDLLRTLICEKSRALDRFAALEDLAQIGRFGPKPAGEESQADASTFQRDHTYLSAQVLFPSPRPGPQFAPVSTTLSVIVAASPRAMNAPCFPSIQSKRWAL